MNKTARNAVVSMMIGATLTTGCFGHFALTNKVWQLNQSVGNKWIQTLVFWAFAIIPVYAVSALLDTFIFNVIEFWSGHNILAANGTPPVTKMVADKNGKPAKLTFLDGGRHVRIEGVDGALDLRVVQTHATLHDGNGRLLSETRLMAGGGFEVRDGTGQVVLTRDAGQVQALAGLLHSSTAAFVDQLDVERGARVASAR